MDNKYNIIDKYLSGKTSPEETIEVLASIATNPELEEYLITQKRLDYEENKLLEYSSFIPASSMAADDGRNLCDFECEKYILKKAGLEVDEDELSNTSRRNYWLRNQGTPLFSVGRLLESKGFFVTRSFDNNLQSILSSLADMFVIAIVNGDVLKPTKKNENIVGINNDANHAVVVLNISEQEKRVSLFNPANEEDVTVCDLDVFLNAWNESKNYMVTIKKEITNEYNPQPIDVSRIPLDEELLELVELLAENNHDVWGVGKIEKALQDNRILAYDPVDGDRDVPDKNGLKKMRYSHYFVPYSRLSEEDKKPDRDSVVSTVKLIKRLGYRLVNINSMYKCPDCGEVIEPNFSYCPNCGKPLSWKDFR